ncbi:alpha-galactosidase [Palleronia caenipelagi]|uniref:alpha-galactosidase n=1 Tax=Palleronia caenipelagi TaxID=2489174 RepID=A0A547Q8V1_9RHOB|nr:alpha-galactosidase [Palleronia caenipelagi]TRD22809.1 alpha-galactosidase [Palleronia caenipelagi]
MSQHWRLDSLGQTLLLRVTGDAMADAVYWGPPLPEGEDIGALAAALRPDLGSGNMDAVAPLSICPDPGQSFAGQPGLSIADRSGPLKPRFRFAGAETEDGLALRFTDPALGLTYIARFQVTGDVITAEARLNADHPVSCHWLAAPVLPGPQDSDAIHDWQGSWIREFHRQITPWSQGIRLREARQGRSGHEHPPMALILSRGCTKTSGTARALHLGWSGGHRFVAEELPDGRRQLQMGRSWDSDPVPGTEFSSGTLIIACSIEGEAGIARAFQTYLRDHVVPWPDPERPRPVHYNCWEAVYFDHDPETLTEIATRAAALGAERFVLDDGWFGRRDDDTTSLGDWQVDRRKWPDGLTPLIEHVQSLGMSFGLWVEPEMVNRDSDLFRAHPDWLLGPEDQTPGRGQYALDLSQDAVRDHLFGLLDTLLRDNAIDYLKWDHNRLFPVVDARQTYGIYDLLDRLRTAHPTVEIESCASGGGRIDAGILGRTHRVWLSDSNDAIERLRIQHEAALFLPPAITGSHVGPRQCHTSGRILPMSFRGWVAAQRHMGMEMDPRELNEDEAATLRQIIGWYKETRDWRMGGVTLPLDSDDPAVTPEVQIAADGSRFVLFAGRHASSAQSLPRPQRLAGLEPGARYRVRLLNPEDRPPQSRGAPALLDGPLELTGATLMQAGLALPWSWPATMWVVEGEKL